MEYQIVDLLGEDGIGDAETESIRVLLMFVTALRRKRAEADELSEIEALKADLGRSMSRENCYLNALLEISNVEGSAGAIASAVLFGGKATASAIEAATAGETMQIGSTEGESAVGADETPNPGPNTIGDHL